MRAVEADVLVGAAEGGRGGACLAGAGIASVAGKAPLETWTRMRWPALDRCAVGHSRTVAHETSLAPDRPRVVLAFQKAGIEDLGWGDPMKWVAEPV